MSFIKLRIFPFIPVLLSFYHERLLNFVNALSASIEMIVGCLPFILFFLHLWRSKFPFGIISHLSKKLPSAILLEAFYWVHILFDFIYSSVSNSPSFLMDIFTGYRVLLFPQILMRSLQSLESFPPCRSCVVFLLLQNCFLDSFSAIWLCVCGKISLGLSCWDLLNFTILSFTKLGTFSFCCSYWIVSVNVYKFTDSFLCSLHFTVESISEF